MLPKLTFIGVFAGISAVAAEFAPAGASVVVGTNAFDYGALLAKTFLESELNHKELPDQSTVIKSLFDVDASELLLQDFSFADLSIESLIIVI